MAANASFVPSGTDLLLMVPRLAMKLGSFALSNLPEHVDSVFGIMKNEGSIIADATGGDIVNATASNISTAFSHGTSAAAATAAAMTAAAPENGFLSYMTMPFTFEGVRGFGGMFSYLGSRWALTTFVVVCLSLPDSLTSPSR